MRKTVLILLVLLFAAALPSFAQITKGSILLGGNLSFSSIKTEPSIGNEYTTRSYWVGPSIGAALKENRVFGVGLLAGKTKTGDSQNGLEYSNYGGLIYYRPYLPLGKNFFLFGQTSAAFTTSNNTHHINGVLLDQQKQDVFSLSLYPGVSYAVNEKIHLEVGINNLVQLSYVNTEITTNSNTRNKSKGMSFDINAGSNAPLSIGFRIFLRK